MHQSRCLRLLGFQADQQPELQTVNNKVNLDLIIKDIQTDQNELRYLLLGCPRHLQ